MQSEARPTEGSPAAHPSDTVRTVAGIEVAVRGNGVPVLVLHGTPGGIDVARAMARFLPSEAFRVVTVSRPGYLGTALTGATDSLDDEADRYAGLLDALALDRIAVLAWSGGGPAAYRLAARHPERVASLVVAAGLSGRWAPRRASLPERLIANTRVGAALSRTAARAVPGLVVRTAVAGVSTLRGAALRAHARGILADPERRAFLLDLAATGNTSGAHRPGWDADVRNLGALEPGGLGLGSVQAPTLLVHGDADTDVEPANSARALAEVPGAELLSLPDGTHFALWDHADARTVQARVREHLRLR